MKITIDTKEDSHEDISKILQILTSILEKKGNYAENYNYKGNSPATVDTSNMMTMFNDDQPQKEIPDTPPDFPELFKLTREAKEKKSAISPKIEIF